MKKNVVPQYQNGFFFVLPITLLLRCQHSSETNQACIKVKYHNMGNLVAIAVMVKPCSGGITN